MKVLLVCSSGMSSSLIVKKMREEVQSRKLDYKIGSTNVEAIYHYIDMVDVILFAPQLRHVYETVKHNKSYEHIKILMISNADYGSLNIENILESIMTNF